MTQPNYLQVQTALDRAVDQCDARPDSSGSTLYRGRLAALRDRFARATRETDARYTEWRVALGAELTSLRGLRVACDRAAERADEYGHDDFPRRAIVYTEPAQLFPLVDAVVTWLDAHAGAWAWCGEHAGALRRALAGIQSQKRDAAAAYAVYSVEVKRRVVAYEGAVALLREYIADARREAGAHHPYDGVELDVL